MSEVNITIPADIGDTLYYIDFNDNIIYPMTVFQIRKSRHIGDFLLDLVIDKESWDQKLTVTVPVSDFNKTYFYSLYEAEMALRTKVSEADIFKKMLNTAIVLESRFNIKTKTESGEFIPVKLLNLDFMCLDGVFHLQDESGNEYYYDVKDIGTKIFFEDNFS